MKAIHWTPEMHDTAIAMRLAGKSLIVIGAALGIGHCTVQRYFDRLNKPELKEAAREIGRRNATTLEWTPVMDATLRALRALRATERDCAYCLGISQTAIRNRLEFLWMPLDIPGERRETCPPGDDMTWRLISPVPWRDVAYLARAA